MDRRSYDGSSAFYQRTDNPEEYSNQRDWYKRSSRDPWERSVDSFLEGDSTRKDYRERSRSRSPDRDRSRSRRRSSSRDRERRSSRERRGSPRDDGREDRRSKDGDSVGRSRDHYRDRREWDEDRYRNSYDRWSRYDRDISGKRDEWLEKVWLTNDNSSDVLSSYSGDSDFDKFRSMVGDRYSGEEIIQNRTIIIRGLAQHITENDIRTEIKKCNLQPTDIRMIRRKNGTSRGFAFVEFATTEEAIQCMEMKNGELMLNNHYRAIMQFSLPKEPRDKRNSDWHCKCSAHNFKRREFCYKCGCTREKALEGVEEVSSHPTNTVLLRGLDTLTNEASVLECIQTVSTLPIRHVRIGRDPATNTSLGVCYIEMNCTIDATYLHNALLMADPVIDEKKPIISYFKSDTSSAPASKAGNTAVEAAQWSHQKTTSSQYTLKDVSRLAEYSANLYATTPEEKQTYLTYYQQYYHKQITEGEQISLPANASTANLATKSGEKLTALTEAPNGSGENTYPVPDVSTYQYDKTSGYYYDPYTTLYYDANSQYYYNSKLSKFLYWDSIKSTYLPAPTASNTSSAPPLPLPENCDEAAKEEELKKLKEKEKVNDKDKVKVAKRIAKDMEKWAKTLNHKKEIAKQNLIASASSMPMLKAQGAADIGFAVLERKDPTAATFAIPAHVDSPIVPNQVDNSLVAEYGQGSDSEEEMDDSENYDKEHTDWNKLACLLCKRQFQTKDILIKHQQFSDLHKQNLNKWFKAKGIDPELQKEGGQYRDRAKERRLKYGEPDKPQPNRLKETYIKAKEASVSYEEPTKMGIGADNLGNKLLQKMGWQEGMGLGKKNQGRTTIIEAERRSATAGLGTKSQGVVPGPGETYKDCVRKMMYIRYKELDDV